MRTTADADAVRLYHLDGESGATTTLLYAPLTEALAFAATEPEEVQAALWVQTSNNLVAYLDLVG